MADQTPVEKMRYNLAGADKARKLAARYEAMHDSLRHDGEHTIGAVIRSKYTLFNNQPHTLEFALDRDDAKHLAEWFYEMHEKELRRAQSYEGLAIRAASKTQEGDR